MLKSEIINPVWDSKPPKPYPVQRHLTSLGHIRECSTCVIQVAPNIWVPKLHTQGVHLSLCGIMALLWRKSYNSTHYLQVHFLFSYFEYCKYRRQRKVSNDQFSWVSYDCTAFKEFSSKYLSSLIISYPELFCTASSNDRWPCCYQYCFEGHLLILVSVLKDLTLLVESRRAWNSSSSFVLCVI